MSYARGPRGLGRATPLRGARAHHEAVGVLLLQRSVELALRVALRREGGETRQKSGVSVRWGRPRRAAAMPLGAGAVSTVGRLRQAPLAEGRASGPACHTPCARGAPPPAGAVGDCFDVTRVSVRSEAEHDTSQV